MRYIIWGWLALRTALPARAQTFDEWFKQNSTRLKYYAGQIAALQVSLGEMERGYEVSDAGLSSISGAKQAEFELHQSYYASFFDVNLSVAALGEVTEIGALQVATVQRFSKALTRYRNEGLLGPARLTCLAQVYNSVLQACLVDVETLTEVLTAGHWQMTDDQRVGRIKTLDALTKDRYAFVLDITDRVDLMQRQQAAESADLATLKTLYGVP